ncbi:unnamed protein product, partial [Phaeothamnion confervicola]
MRVCGVLSSVRLRQQPTDLEVLPASIFDASGAAAAEFSILFYLYVTSKGALNSLRSPA